MATIEYVTVEVADTAAADHFYTAAFDFGSRVRLRASEAPTNGFRAKLAGVSADGTGDAGPFTDPDGFLWEST